MPERERNEQIIETITIPLEEYKKLLETHTRVEVFKTFANKENYSVSKKDCGALLGFEVECDGED